MAKHNWKKVTYEIIFEADTPAGKWFDIILLWAIILSVITVMLESVNEIHRDYYQLLKFSEWFFTILFTAEYGLRVITIKKPIKYVTSFFGLVDLLSFIPTYLALVFTGTHFLMTIRILRLLRVFRVLKLVRYVGAASTIIEALKASKAKIVVFIGAVLSVVTIMGTLLYIVEDPESGFTSIPRSIYWAIVTLTTVGYGDIAPQTVFGQTLASAIMLLGYSIIAVPTGLVTVEFAKQEDQQKIGTQHCGNCSSEGHDSDAKFCKYCGESLD